MSLCAVVSLSKAAKHRVARRRTKGKAKLKENRVNQSLLAIKKATAALTIKRNCFLRAGAGEGDEIFIDVWRVNTINNLRICLLFAVLLMGFSEGF